MFFVFNKPKIYSYLIVLSTVVVLFFTAEVLSESKNIETLTTSSEILEEGSIINRFNTDKKEIAITVNCINSDENIQEILDILDKNKINISFGIYGEWIKKYPELTKKINEKGNGIIALSNTNRDISNLDYDETSKEIIENVNKINSLLDKKISLIRCPYGRYSDNILHIAGKNGYKLIGWSIDTLDYQGLEANDIWDNIKSKITNGDIIMMNSNAEHIKEELELIISSVKQRGFNIIKIEERV